MTPYLFDGSFCAEAITDLFSFLANVKKPGIEIYMRSAGGEVELARIIADYLNKHHNSLKISLTGFEMMSSAAFVLLTLLECPIRLLPGTKSVIHFINMQTSVQEVKGSREYKVDEISIDEANTEFYNWLKSKKVLTATQMKDLKNYKDVVLDYKQLCKLFNL